MPTITLPVELARAIIWDEEFEGAEGWEEASLRCDYGIGIRNGGLQHPA